MEQCLRLSPPSPTPCDKNPSFSLFLFFLLSLSRLLSLTSAVDPLPPLPPNPPKEAYGDVQLTQYVRLLSTLQYIPVSGLTS